MTKTHRELNLAASHDVIQEGVHLDDLQTGSRNRREDEYLNLVMMQHQTADCQRPIRLKELRLKGQFGDSVMMSQ